MCIRDRVEADQEMVAVKTEQAAGLILEVEEEKEGSSSGIYLLRIILKSSDYYVAVATEMQLQLHICVGNSVDDIIMYTVHLFLADCKQLFSLGREAIP